MCFVNIVKKWLQVHSRRLATLTIRWSFIFQHDDLIVSACHIAINVQLILRHKTFLHETQEGFLLILLSLFLIFSANLLFFGQHINHGVDHHGHLHGKAFNIDLGVDTKRWELFVKMFSEVVAWDDGVVLFVQDGQVSDHRWLLLVLWFHYFNLI